MHIFLEKHTLQGSNKTRLPVVILTERTYKVCLNKNKKKGNQSERTTSQVSRVHDTEYIWRFWKMLLTAYV